MKEIDAEADSTSASKTAEITSKWLKGIPYEVAFWRSYYRSTRRRADLFSWSLYGKSCDLDNFDVQKFMRDYPDANPVAVDLGCALSYTFGDLFDGRDDVCVEYVDPLAPFYNRILDRHNIDRPRIRFGMIENISATFAPGSVALIHVRNALDHCSDPMRGVIESLACLAVGGVLYLNHFRNEALRESYRGFHQWNINLDENGKLIFWNPDFSIDVAEVLGNVVGIETSVTDTGRIVAVIRKTAQLPKSMYNPAETTRRSSEMLMDTVQFFHSVPRTAVYNISRLTATVGHTLMRLLPFSIVNKIKKLASRRDSR